MTSSTDLEFLMVFVTLILTLVLTWMVYGIARELNLGIFRRFFKLNGARRMIN
ncbi:MAG: hypothetical protein QXD24_07730 [Candidatus Caldarchaeum sp.]